MGPPSACTLLPVAPAEACRSATPERRVWLWRTPFDSFVQGTSGSVTISNLNPGFVVVDAVRFHKR